MKRDPFAPRAVVSRRGGAPKIPLTRELIVDKALELLTRDGLEGMSLRKVASALETGAASLYAYVDDLHELETLVLDRALVRVRGSSGPWRKRLESLLASYYRALSRSPGLALLAMRVIAAGPNALRILEELLGILDDAGMNPRTAAWASDLLLLYVTAIAAEQEGRRGQADPLGVVMRMIGGVDASTHPRVHRVKEELVSGEGRERFAWAIDVLVEGMRKVTR